MGVFWITARGINGGPTYQFGFETEAGCIADFCAALNGGDLVCGDQLDATRVDADGARRITGRRPVAVTKGEVLKIETPRCRYVEEVD